MDRWSEEQVRQSASGYFNILTDERIPKNPAGSRIPLPELPQGSTLFTLLLVSPQGSGAGAIEGGGAPPPPQGSVLSGDVGDATPHGSEEAVPHGPDIPEADIMGGGEGPAEPIVAAVAGAPHGSTVLSSIKAPYQNNRFQYLQIHLGHRVKVERSLNGHRQERRSYFNHTSSGFAFSLLLSSMAICSLRSSPLRSRSSCQLQRPCQQRSHMMWG